MVAVLVLIVQSLSTHEEKRLKEIRWVEGERDIHVYRESALGNVEFDRPMDAPLAHGWKRNTLRVGRRIQCNRVGRSKQIVYFYDTEYMKWMKKRRNKKKDDNSEYIICILCMLHLRSCQPMECLCFPFRICGNDDIDQCRSIRLLICLLQCCFNLRHTPHDHAISPQCFCHILILRLGRQ